MNACILHISQRSTWESALSTGNYRADSLERDGFIHCSRPDQVLEVANRFYREGQDLVVLWVRLDQLAAEVRWEPADGDTYPHVYGEINCTAVVQAVPLVPDEDGVYRRFAAPG